MGLNYGNYGRASSSNSTQPTPPPKKKKPKPIYFKKQITRIVHSIKHTLPGLENEDVFEMLELKRDKWNDPETSYTENFDSLEYYSNPLTGSIEDLYHAENEFSLLLNLPIEVMYTSLVEYLNFKDLLSLAKSSRLIYGEFIRQKKYIFRKHEKALNIAINIHFASRLGLSRETLLFKLSLCMNIGSFIFTHLRKHCSESGVRRWHIEDDISFIFERKYFLKEIVKVATTDDLDTIQSNYKYLHKLVMESFEE